MGVHLDEIRQENGRHQKTNLTGGTIRAVYGQLKSFTDKIKTFQWISIRKVVKMLFVVTFLLLRKSDNQTRIQEILSNCK